MTTPRRPNLPNRSGGLVGWISDHKLISGIAGLVIAAVVLTALFGDGEGGTATRDIGGPTETTTTTSSPPSTEGIATPTPPPLASVPPVEGKALAKAAASLKSLGFVVVTEKKFSKEPAATVLRADPAPGDEVPEGTTVVLVVAKPYPKVPSVVGMTSAKATSTLKKAGYKVTISKETSSQAVGSVLRQTPVGGTQMLPGKTVKIVVAKAAPPPSTSGGSSNCTPGYSPCLPPASDYDCAGGSGDGPEYVYGTVRVTGSDPYGLDSDGDGYGCEG